MDRHRGWLFALVTSIALFFGQPAFAGAPTDQLRPAIDRVVAILEDPALEAEGRAAERRQAVRAVAERLFDAGETASRALGRHWRVRTDAERREFVDLYRSLFEHAYLGGIDLAGRVHYTGESIDDDAAVVRTSVVFSKTGAEVPVDYRMLRLDDRWLVFDVVVEGMSLVANYGSQFDQIIEETSYQELVRRLRQTKAVMEESS